MLRHAAVINSKLTLCEESVGVCVVQVLGSAQAANKVVPISIVITGALDLGKMGHLVENSGGLVLSVASAGKSRQASEEEWAVDHLTGGWVSVSQDTAGAGTKDISAIVAGVARG